MALLNLDVTLALPGVHLVFSCGASSSGSFSFILTSGGDGSSLLLRSWDIYF